MVKFVVVLLEFDLPYCCARANFVGFTLVSEVVVVGLNDDGYRCSSKEM